MRLTEVHRRAIELLMVPGATNRSVAAIIGKHEVVVSRWFSDPDFKAAYNERVKKHQADLAKNSDQRMPKIIELAFDCAEYFLTPRETDEGKKIYPQAPKGTLGLVTSIMKKAVPDRRAVEHTHTDAPDRTTDMADAIAQRILARRSAGGG